MRRYRRPSSTDGGSPSDLSGDTYFGRRGNPLKPGCAGVRLIRRSRQVLHQLDTWMYKGGRPNRLASVLNGVWRLVGVAGLPPHRLNALEVEGRRTGKLRSFPVVVADYEGERYLVAMLGEGANWVANVRVSGEHAVLRHGRREAVRLEEVDPASRAPILKRYLQLAPGARAHIPVDRQAALADFDAVAQRYPVFRVRSDSPSQA